MPPSCAARWPGAGSSSLDVSEARRAPGVVAVLTAAEINSRTRRPRAARSTRLPGACWPTATCGTWASRSPSWWPSPRYLAEDAAELVNVDIDPQDAVVTAAQALAEGSPRVHPELPDNLSGVVPAEDLPGPGRPV